MTSLRRKQKVWHAELEAWFDEQGIRWCERCGRSGIRLDISHGRKRRFLITREAYFFAARLCRACHIWAEFGKEPGKPYERATHERLARIHNELIARRGMTTAVSG